MHDTPLRRSRTGLIAVARSLAVAALLSVAAARGAAAQSSMTAACVGGPSIGCNQINFTLTAMGALPATVDFFRIAITGGDFRFNAALPGQAGSATDQFGDFFFIPAVSAGGIVLSGTFPDFPASLNPFLMLIGQVQPNTRTNTSSLAFTYEAGANGRVTFSGAVTATPEPASLVLLATGLLAIGGMAVRRRRVA